jgi:hypothetical protein
MASSGTHLNHQKQSMAGVQVIIDPASSSGSLIAGDLF